MPPLSPGAPTMMWDASALNDTDEPKRSPSLASAVAAASLMLTAPALKPFLRYTDPASFPSPGAPTAIHVLFLSMATDQPNSSPTAPSLA